jgi:hypothetical protein
MTSPGRKFRNLRINSHGRRVSCRPLEESRRFRQTPLLARAVRTDRVDAICAM